MSQIQASDRRRGRQHGRSATLGIVLGLLLALSSVFAPASPSSAAAFGSDTNPDQSTGPTAPNGPPY